jgi:hypothetical protein
MLGLSLNRKERIVLKNRKTGEIIAKIEANQHYSNTPTIARLVFDSPKEKVAIYREKK